MVMVLPMVPVTVMAMYKIVMGTVAAVQKLMNVVNVVVMALMKALVTVLVM